MKTFRLLLVMLAFIGLSMNSIIAQISVAPTSIYQEVAEGSTSPITKQITVTNSGSDSSSYNSWIAYNFEPINGSEVYNLKYCGDPYYGYSSFTNTTLAEIGVKFSKNDLCDKMGTYITKMSYYLKDLVGDSTLKFRIYGACNYGSPGEILMEFTKPCIDIGQWNEITLPQPLLINKSEVWLTVEFIQIDGYFPVGRDNGPLKPGVNFVKKNGGTWIEVPPTYSGNFLIKAESTGGVVPACWLSLIGNSHGNIPSGGSANFNAALNPSGLEYDAYRANITISTNDQNNPIKEVPTTLVVLPSPPAPIIYVTPKSISETAYEIGTITKQITVTNYGNATGTYNASLEGVTNNWISLTGNTTGSVPDGNNHVNFNAVINTAGLTYGTYTATLKVSTSDVKHPLFEIPCKLVYEPATPEMSVTPTSIDETIVETTTITIPITISNTGNASGEYEAQLEGTSGNWISLSGAATGTVAGGSNKTFDVVINSAGLDYGTYTATIKITTNDPVHPLFEIPCTIILSKEGIDAILLGDHTIVYPNPTTGEWKIENGKLKIENVEIYDVFGRVMEIAHPNYKNSNPISSPFEGSPAGEGGWSFRLGGLLPSGIYFIRITTDNGMITKKVVKQ